MAQYRGRSKFFHLMALSNESLWLGVSNFIWR